MRRQVGRLAVIIVGALVSKLLEGRDKDVFVLCPWHLRQGVIHNTSSVNID